MILNVNGLVLRRVAELRAARLRRRGDLLSLLALVVVIALVLG